MHWSNSRNSYGLVAIFMHWVTAFVVIGLFALGLWMTGLDYYHSWYVTAPNIHKSLGVAVVGLMLLRLLWKLGQQKVVPVDPSLVIQNRIAIIVHFILYALVISMLFTGYLITTGEGDSLIVFGTVVVPAILEKSASFVDLMGELHEWAGFIIMGLVALHSFAALKHHFIDKDETLKRMLSLRSHK